LEVKIILRLVSRVFIRASNFFFILVDSTGCTIKKGDPCLKDHKGQQKGTKVKVMSFGSFGLETAENVFFFVKMYIYQDNIGTLRYNV